MSDLDNVRATMPGYVADFIAGALEAAAVKNPRDSGYLDLADMLRNGGRDAEVQVIREVSDDE